MPLQDEEKDTQTLLAEVKNGVPGNLTAIHAKLDLLIAREIKNGDADDIVISGEQVTRKGTRPYQTPHV